MFEIKTNIIIVFTGSFHPNHKKHFTTYLNYLHGLTPKGISDSLMSPLTMLCLSVKEYDSSSETFDAFSVHIVPKIYLHLRLVFIVRLSFHRCVTEKEMSLREATKALLSAETFNFKKARMHKTQTYFSRSELNGSRREVTGRTDPISYTENP